MTKLWRPAIKFFAEGGSTFAMAFLAELLENMLASAGEENGEDGEGRGGRYEHAWLSHWFTLVVRQHNKLIGMCHWGFARSCFPTPQRLQTEISNASPREPQHHMTYSIPLPTLPIVHSQRRIRP